MPANLLKIHHLAKYFRRKKLQKIRINSKPTPSITSKAYVLKNAVWVPGLRSSEASVLWFPKLLKLPNPLNSNPLPPKNKKLIVSRLSDFPNYEGIS